MGRARFACLLLLFGLIAGSAAAQERASGLGFGSRGFIDRFNIASRELGLLAHTTLRSCVEDKSIACSFVMTSNVQGFTVGPPSDLAAERLIVMFPEEETWQVRQVVEALLAVIYPDLPAGMYLATRASVLNALHPTIRPHATEVAGLKLSVIPAHRGSGRWLVVQPAE